MAKVLVEMTDSVLRELDRRPVFRGSYQRVDRPSGIPAYRPQPTTSAELYERAAAAEQAEEAATLARAEAAEAEALRVAEAQAKADARAALVASLKRDADLAKATSSLIGAIGALLLGQPSEDTLSSLMAEFRTELQPLANVYGCKIVLVGNKTKATLVVK